MVTWIGDDKVLSIGFHLGIVYSAIVLYSVLDMYC